MAQPSEAVRRADFSASEALVHRSMPRTIAVSGHLLTAPAQARAQETYPHGYYDGMGRAPQDLPDACRDLRREILPENGRWFARFLTQVCLGHGGEWLCVRPTGGCAGAILGMGRRESVASHIEQMNNARGSHGHLAMLALSSPGVHAHPHLPPAPRRGCCRLAWVTR